MAHHTPTSNVGGWGWLQSWSLIVSFVCARGMVARWNSSSNPTNDFSILHFTTPIFPFSIVWHGVFTFPHVTSKWNRRTTEVNSKWNQSEIEVNRHEIEVTSTWNQNEIDMTPKWSRSEIDVKSKCIRSEIEVKSKWARNKFEVKSNCTPPHKLLSNFSWPYRLDTPRMLNFTRLCNAVTVELDYVSVTLTMICS